MKPTIGATIDLRALMLAGVALLAACATAPNAVASEPKDILIGGERIFPESVTSDSAGNVYNSSMSGVVYRTTPGGTTAEPWIRPSAENGLLSLFGVLADERHGVLWACTNPGSFGGARDPNAGSSVIAFDLKTGAFRARYPFPAGPAACNDIAIARNGDAYITDTAQGRLFKLAEKATALELFASDPKLVGVDGIAFAGDGKMYINNVRANTVERVNVSAAGAYAGLTVLTLSEPVKGPDGIRPLGGNKFLQAEGSGNRVALIEIDGDNAKVTPIKTGLNSSPGVTHVNGVGYATEGKIGYLIDPKLQGQDPGQFYIRAFALPEGL
jgi:hypothetical protein